MNKEIVGKYIYVRIAKDTRCVLKICECSYNSYMLLKGIIFSTYNGALRSYAHVVQTLDDLQYNYEFISEEKAYEYGYGRSEYIGDVDVDLFYWDDE